LPAGTEIETGIKYIDIQKINHICHTSQLDLNPILFFISLLSEVSLGLIYL
jgi:hypothetical protein